MKDDKYYIIEINDNESLIDDELREKIEENKKMNFEKPLSSIIFVRVIGVISILISLLMLATLINPLFNAISEKNTSILLQISVYLVIVIVYFFSAINLILLNNFGRIIQFIVLFIYIALKIFEILYRNLNEEEFYFAIWSSIIAFIFAIILITKPVSKAF